MSESVSLPALGESVTEGTVTRWLKSVGDRVEVDEPLLEVSTDKVDTEIPSPVAGVIEKILVQEDETVEVGTALVTIGDGSGTGDDEGGAQPQEAGANAQTEQEQPAQQHEQPAQKEEQEPEQEPEQEQAQPAQPEPESVEESGPSPATPTAADEAPAPKPEQPEQEQPKQEQARSGGSHAGAGYVTPIVRKLANERGVDLSTVTGSGVGGRIRKEDILSASNAPAGTAAPELTVSELRGTTQPMSRLRKVVADRAVVSMQSSAQLTSVVEVDVTKIAALRDRVKQQFQQKTGNKLSFLPFFAKAATEALKAYPVINATVEDESIVYPDHENLSIAVDTERGLLTPVVRNAGDLNIAELAAQIADLADRTRANKLKPDELAGGTFTLTNTGSRGALFDTPIVFLPQVAILGTGVVRKAPVVVTTDGSDAIAIRSTVFLALSYDHRIVDGADAARFLVAVKNRLEGGAFENDLGI